MVGRSYIRHCKLVALIKRMLSQRNSRDANRIRDEEDWHVTKSKRGMSTPSVPAGDAQTGDTGSEKGEFSFIFDLTSAPCFRQSTLYAIGGGATIGGLQLYRTKDVMRSAETMVKTGCGIALLNWVVCRKRFYDEREATYRAVENVRKQRAARAAAKAKEMREGGEEKES